MSEHPEHHQYRKSSEEIQFHESKMLESNNEKCVLVDVDETVCFYSSKRRYDLAKPNKDNIAKINKLYDEGWRVIYWTARGGSDRSKADGKCYYDFTWKQLESWGCKFHDLSTGTKGKNIKPPNDLIVDDKAKRIEELNWIDLAPDICRQRLIVEGTLHNVFLPEEMTTYCNEITKVLNMTYVTSATCNHAPEYGWCAYMHWKESGMHVYGWDKRTPKFFSIDIYTCRAFKSEDVVEYTKKFFGNNLIDIAWKE